MRAPLAVTGPRLRWPSGGALIGTPTAPNGVDSALMSFSRRVTGLSLIMNEAFGPTRPMLLCSRWAAVTGDRTSARVAARRIRHECRIHAAPGTRRQIIRRPDLRGPWRPDRSLSVRTPLIRGLLTRNDGRRDSCGT